ncbi:hypothetical protein [Roseibium sp. RKSG952]|uniref:hypothetical protein n=1 Tax=Roseibium sp. RKSG952 TaxID=2529384 RepID=UPI0012BC4097|nr:hypothetical protein [Roseibium sp. RKSG952]MTI00422.1 hypothetical protein [Roseibium sp. RKSG952]
MMKVIIADADGNEIEHSEDPEDEADGAISANKSESALAERWAKIRTAFAPMVKAHGEAGASNAQKVLSAWSAAIKAAEAGRYQDALQVAARLKPVLGGSGKPDPKAAAWTRLEPNYTRRVNDLEKEGSGAAAKIAAAWSAARKAAQSGDFAKALIIAAKLKPHLTAPPANAVNDGLSSLAKEAAATIPAGIVQKRKFMIDRWSRVPGELREGISALAAAVPKIAPWEDAGAVSRLVEDHFGGIADRMRNDIGASFDQDVNAGDSSYAATKSTISGLQSALEADPLLSELKKGLVTSGAPFLNAFEQALAEIDAAL